MTERDAGAVDDDFEEVVRALWFKHLPSFLGQVDAVAAYASGAVDLPDEARTAAHRLAGSLGSYGLGPGSILAARIEERLADAAPVDRAEIGALVDELRPLVETFHTES